MILLRARPGKIALRQSCRKSSDRSHAYDISDGVAADGEKQDDGLSESWYEGITILIDLL